ncbi:MAG: hypothetical protein IJC16_00070 [Rikenellaceae bacterium]|nr:hypothetical protein [Rikenellaceae bacterium]
MKTAQEAAREYANDNGFMLDEWHDIHNAFLAGNAFGYRRGMKEAYRWISVSEELPETNPDMLDMDARDRTMKVLVKLRSGGWSASYRYNFMGQWQWAGSGAFRRSIVAWRPIERKTFDSGREPK